MTSIDTPRKMSSALDANHKLSDIRETTLSTEEFITNSSGINSQEATPAKSSPTIDCDTTTVNGGVPPVKPANELAWRREQSILEIQAKGQKAKRKEGTLLAPNIEDILVDDLEKH